MNVLTLFFAILLPFHVSIAEGVPASGPPLWQFKIDAQLWSPAIEKSGVLYFGADDGYLYAFNLQKKQISWRFLTGGIIRSGVVIDSNLVFFASDDGYLYALDVRSGRQKWRTALGASPRRLPALKGPFDYDYLHSSPVIVKDKIYIGSGRMVVALKAKSGKILWRTQTNAQVRSSPVIAFGRLYVGSWDGRLYALSAQTGKQLWTFESGGIIQDTPAYGDGRVYFGSRSTRFYAVDAKSGKLAWRYHHKGGSWAESSPVFYKGRVYVGSSDALKLFVFDAKSGNLEWEYKTGGWSWGRPKINNNNVYIGSISAYPYYFEGLSLESGFYGLSLDTGKPVLKYQPPDTLDGYIRGGVFNPPVFYKNQLIVMSVDGTISALIAP